MMLPTSSSLSSTTFSCDNNNNANCNHSTTNNNMNNNKTTSATTSTSTTSTTGDESTQFSIDMETLKSYGNTMYTRIQNNVRLDKLRPLPMFLGILDHQHHHHHNNSDNTNNNTNNVNKFLLPNSYNSPIYRIDKSSIEKLSYRLRTNFILFLSNYILITIMTGIVVALIHPGMIIILLLVYCLWIIHHFLSSKNTNNIVLFGISLHTLRTKSNQEIRFNILFIMTCIVIIWKCIIPTIRFIAISFMLILCHALFRDPKKYTSSTHNNNNNNNNISSSSDLSLDEEHVVDNNNNRSNNSNRKRNNTSSKKHDDNINDDDIDQNAYHDGGTNSIMSGSILVEHPTTTTMNTIGPGDV